VVHNKEDLNRRDFLYFLKQSAIAAAVFTAGLGVKPVYAAKKRKAGAGKNVIVIGIDISGFPLPASAGTSFAGMTRLF